MPVHDPATSEALGYVPVSRSEDAAAALDAVWSAFPDWSAMPVGDRVQPLFRLKALLERDMGWAEAFFGDWHAEGRHGVEFHTNVKVVVERWPSAWTRRF